VRGVGIDHYSVGGLGPENDARTPSLLGASVWIIEELRFPPEVFALAAPLKFWALPMNWARLLRRVLPAGDRAFLIFLPRRGTKASSYDRVSIAPIGARKILVGVPEFLCLFVAKTPGSIRLNRGPRMRSSSSMQSCSEAPVFLSMTTIANCVSIDHALLAAVAARGLRRPGLRARRADAQIQPFPVSSASTSRAGADENAVTARAILTENGHTVEPERISWQGRAALRVQARNGRAGRPSLPTGARLHPRKNIPGIIPGAGQPAGMSPSCGTHLNHPSMKTDLSFKLLALVIIAGIIAAFTSPGSAGPAKLAASTRWPQRPTADLAGRFLRSRSLSRIASFAFSGFGRTEQKTQAGPEGIRQDVVVVALGKFPAGHLQAGKRQRDQLLLQLIEVAGHGGRVVHADAKKQFRRQEDPRCAAAAARRTASRGQPTRAPARWRGTD